MAVTQVRPIRAISGEQSPVLKRYLVTYKVTVNSSNDGPQTVMRSGLLPRLLVSTYRYGNDVDTDAWCVDLSAPRRANQGTALREWIVDATFEWDRSLRPEYNPYQIEPFVLKESEAIRNAKFKGFYKVRQGAEEEAWDKAQIENNKLRENITTGVISNSVPTAVLPAPEREVSKQGYRVTWTKRTAFDYSPYLDTCNDRLFVLTGLDITGGVILQKAFQAGLLRLRDAQQTPVNLYGLTWYQQSLEFVEEDCDTYELDRGVEARAEAGGTDGKGGTFSEGDFPEGSSGTYRIQGPYGDVSDPVKLDGNGQPLANQKPENAIYLKWSKYPLSNFSNLPNGVYT